MTKRRPGHATCDRLRSDVEAWLPSTDSGAQQQIVDLLTQAAATGADPIATLRDGLRQWFGTGASAMLPHPPSPIAAFEATAIPFEALIGLRRPTLWPQRPKRLTDELFSSWLWRCARHRMSPLPCSQRMSSGRRTAMSTAMSRRRRSAGWPASAAKRLHLSPQARCRSRRRRRRIRSAAWLKIS